VSRPQQFTSKSGFADHEHGRSGVQFEFAVEIRLARVLPIHRVVDLGFGNCLPFRIDNHSSDVLRLRKQ
jgi:hypothetical protein